ncbi:MAG: hypothetical protein D6753_14515 [Planctomycetota bacterium]|nr:MAG: hypothetical protein D6753_14515 [Planctomycetota bacterium]
MHSIVTLLTDFGLQDSYVGQVKGAILAVDRRIQVVDLCHAVPPQNVLSGAFELRRGVEPFPEGTVHVAVVDPGVGTDRRIVAVRANGHYFVAPDNGLLSWILADLPVDAVVEVSDPKYWRREVSATFHGRDIMGPVGAHLATGEPLHQFGPEIDAADLRLLDERVLESQADIGRASVSVLHVDRFGNVVLSVRGPAPRWSRASVRTGAHAHVAQVVRCYGEAPVGQLVLLVGSSGYWELAVVGGAAAELLEVQPGDLLDLEEMRG